MYFSSTCTYHADVNLEAANALRFKRSCKLCRCSTNDAVGRNADRNITFTFVPAPRGTESGPRQQLTARLQANNSQDSTSPPTGPATMPDQQLASMIASIVEQKLATLNSASNSPLASFSQPLSNIYQAFRTSHQIPLSQMFAMADNNRFPPLWISRCPPCSKTGTPEDAAFLHTNYRVPSIASHLSNSCIAATRALLYPSHPRLSSCDRPVARRLCHLLVRTPLLLPIPEGGPLRLSATDT